jgi:8-oxo-dGTP pyrophosphatase MutT (NUDIX family)
VKKDYSYGVIPVYRNDVGKLEILAIKHSMGHWAFPKGHKIDKETDIETARRELFEETGIVDCNVDERKKFLDRYIWEPEGTKTDKTVTYYLGVVQNRNVNLKTSHNSKHNEIVEANWISFKEARDLIQFPELLKAIDEIEEWLSGEIS